MLRSYLQRIAEIAGRGDAREESYYGTLAELLKRYAESSGKPRAQVTMQPKKTEAGNPDFRVWDGRQHIIGYIEAKKPTETDLQAVQSSEQLKRYRQTFPNLILTNFFEFRLFRDGDLVEVVQVARPFVLHKLKSVPPVEREEEFFAFLEKFFAFSLPRTYSARTLAVELAKRTRFLKEQVIEEELKEETERGAGHLLGFYEAFQRHLIAGLKPEDFADLYAQTITYGLFAARTRAENGFSRRQAFDNIPRTIGILRDVFRFISLEDLPKPLEWIVDDIAQVLAVADVNRILHRYYEEGRGRDPIVHFYETFLAEYDPEARERRGVYYTPEPVVSYIVRSLHRILKEVFRRKDGFASDSVRVLDPAAGTLTFPAEAAKLAVEEFVRKYGAGTRESLIRDHILKNFYAFELMMAPYAVGHLKIGFLLEELGHRLGRDERFPLYLTNTLEMEELEQSSLPGMASLAEESHLAGRVKKETPILVILGNPPYSGHSANVGEWISREIKAYYRVDGKPLGEKNPKWLQDDYVKFLRFAQWKIDQAGEGVLGFITNHSYLDNPTFRGMRQSLMESFNQVYFLDLHGNSLKKERCPDGSEDKNVFDIRQGVAIALFIKKPGLERKVCHAETWGQREKKSRWLEEHDIRTTEWKEIHPKSEFYFFVPRDEELLGRYEQWPKVTEIFPVNSVGIVTSRDEFVIDFDREALKRRIRMFRDKSVPDEIIRQAHGLKEEQEEEEKEKKSKRWSLKKSRKAVMADSQWEEKIVEIHYRPFDTRWIFYSEDVIERSRIEVMRHMLRENLALIAPRQIKEEPGAFITQHIAGHKTVSVYDINSVFPLYLYEEKKATKKTKDSALTLMLFEPKVPYMVRRPNLSPQLVETLTATYKKRPTLEEIFYYVYAVLYAPTYRAKYAEFLKIDFPRVPFTRDRQLFSELARLGKKLVELHLLNARELDRPVARFQGKGDNRVEKQIYSEREKRVYINKTQYFEGVEPEVWAYQVGGYQVLDKWLKDRRKRILNLDDIRHYCRVVTVLEKTKEIQNEIDAAYRKAEKNTVFNNTR